LIGTITNRTPQSKRAFFIDDTHSMLPVLAHRAPVIAESFSTSGDTAAYPTAGQRIVALHDGLSRKPSILQQSPHLVGNPVGQNAEQHIAS
jgi:hypothetical protein